MSDSKLQGGFSWHEPARPRGALLPSATCEWATPSWLFRLLDDEFHFTLDAAASPDNAKCERFYTKEQNGIIQPWDGERVWCNPPYDVGNLSQFVGRAYYGTQHGTVPVAVLLVPVKSDQEWWHRFAINSEVRFIRGRVTFGDAACTAPMPVCVLVFSPLYPPRMTTLAQPQTSVFDAMEEG